MNYSEGLPPLANIIQRYFLSSFDDKNIIKKNLNVSQSIFDEHIKIIIQEINNNVHIIEDMRRYNNNKDEEIFIKIINGYYGYDFLQNHINSIRTELYTKN